MPKEKPSEHIDKIRAKVRIERTNISGLMRSHRKNELLKHYLKDASSFLDMVDGYFLEPAILHRDRTATEWAYWLGGADRAFEDAKALRKHVEKLIEKFGPDVTMARS